MLLKIILLPLLLVLFTRSHVTVHRKIENNYVKGQEILSEGTRNSSEQY